MARNEVQVFNKRIGKWVLIDTTPGRRGGIKKTSKNKFKDVPVKGNKKSKEKPKKSKKKNESRTKKRPFSTLFG